MPHKPWPTAHWPVGVPHEITGFDRPLYALLDDAAERYPDHIYTIFSGAGRTYAKVKDTSSRVATFLADRGIGKGDRVAIFLPNLPQYPEIYFGILKAGAVCVTCNPLYTAAELNYQLKDAGAKAVFCMDHPQFYPTTREAIAGTGVRTVVICGIRSYLPFWKAVLGRLLGKIPKADNYEDGHLFFDEVIPATSAAPPSPCIHPQTDPALIVYTGGTTGVPKGAVLSHANLMSNVMALDAWVCLPQGPGKKPQGIAAGLHSFLGVLPWYHSFGMTVVMLWSCHAAGRLVCIPDPRAGNPPFTEVLKAVQKYKTTILAGVPTIFMAFTHHPLLKKYDLSSIQGCGSGGAPLPVEVARQFEARTGAIIFEAYGLSETAPVATANPTDVERRRFGTVGFPFPNTDVKILDSGTGLAELPWGQDGEIAVSGPQVMLGYWNRPEENEAVFREIEGRRYFLTGDIGHIDKDGYIVITDRKKDMILVGGFNCYPREVEEVLFAHPKIALAAVVGVPDPRSGEAVKAYVQLRSGESATEKEIIDFCRTRLAAYKCPKKIEFRGSLPVSPVGKILRRVLRDEGM